MRTKFPALLKKNDKIAVVSPSAAVMECEEWETLFKRATKIVESLGLKVVLGRNCKLRRGYLAGTLKERLEDLHEAFANQDVKLIIATQGGNNSNQLLPFIDYELIKKNPKFFLGLSDISVLLNAIFKKTGLITYHGQDFMWGLGKNAQDYTKENLYSTLFKGKFEFKRNPVYGKWKIVREGVGTGRCIGGCLPSFVLLGGTRYQSMQKNEPFILILEDMGQSLSVIDSLITQITLNECFSKCKGIIVGNFIFEGGSKNTELLFEKLLLERTKNYSPPILKVTEIGHCVENFLMPIGSNLTLNCIGKPTIKTS